MSVPDGRRWWHRLARRRAFLAMLGASGAVLAGRLWWLPRAYFTSEEELLAYYAEQVVVPRTGTPLDDRGLWRYRFTGVLDDLRLNSVEGEQAYDADTYRLRLGGLARQPRALSVADVWRLPTEQQVSDFYCVDGWVVRGLAWRGVRLRTLLALADAPAGVTHIGLRAIGGVYSESLPLEVALRDDVMLATHLRGGRLPARHGAPLRLLVPPMYGYKSIKWVEHLDLLPRVHLGYWERRGYHPDAWLP